MSNTPSCAVSHVAPCALNVKAWWSVTAFFRLSLYFQTLFL